MAAPSDVSSFAAIIIGLSGQIDLSWVNSGGSFTGVMIRYRTDGTYPTSISDGTQIYNSNGTSYAHTGLTNGLEYRYKAFAHNAVPEYAAGVTALKVAVAPRIDGQDRATKIIKPVRTLPSMPVGAVRPSSGQLFPRGN
jgi:hypothetical protein